MVHNPGRHGLCRGPSLEPCSLVVQTCDQHPAHTVYDAIRFMLVLHLCTGPGQLAHGLAREAKAKSAWREKFRLTLRVIVQQQLVRPRNPDATTHQRASAEMALAPRQTLAAASLQPTTRHKVAPDRRCTLQRAQLRSDPEYQAARSADERLATAQHGLVRSAAAPAAAGIAVLCAAQPALALTLQAEPANALSLPTWAIHVSSVVEWCALAPATTS